MSKSLLTFYPVQYEYIEDFKKEIYKWRAFIQIKSHAHSSIMPPLNYGCLFYVVLYDCTKPFIIGIISFLNQIFALILNYMPIMKKLNIKTTTCFKLILGPALKLSYHNITYSRYIFKIPVGPHHVTYFC